MRWTRTSIGILLGALLLNLGALINFFGCEVCGSELAFWVFVLNFPSSILTGMALRHVQWTTASTWQIWTPFFVMGMAQWIAVAVIGRQMKTRP